MPPTSSDSCQGRRVKPWPLAAGPAARRSRFVRAACVASGLLVAAACGDSDGNGGLAAPEPRAPSASPTASATVSSPIATTATTAAPAPPAKPAADQTIRITYRGGVVSGAGGRVKVKRGSTVAIVVTSDIADEVHLHGYDRSVAVAKGATATLTFTATIPGGFELELEKTGRRLTQIQVT